MPNVSEIEPTTTRFYFQFTLLGHIELAEGGSYLVCRDNIRFRLKDAPSNPPEELTSWRVIPTTDSTGVIQNLSVESYSIGDNSGDASERCLLLGRVVQLGKRGQFVQIKVSRPGEKTLKISLLSPDPRMKMGQLWEILAIRNGDTLLIQQANPIEEVHHSPQPQIPATPAVALPVPQQEQPQITRTPSITTDTDTHLSVSPSKSSAATPTSLSQTASLEQAVHNGNSTAMLPTSSTITIQQLQLSDNTVSPPTEKALAALVAETHIEDWELTTPKQRKNKSWEWDAVSKKTQLQARVQVFGGRKKARVYQYASKVNPQFLEATTRLDSSSEDTLSERLVVRPLGAAKGIGASCFQVMIGPYEIVLDCGTRPKGYDPLPALDYLENPNLLLVSHAHQDHLGAVPVFHARYPGVRMICTPGTREIAHVMLQDCLKVQQLSEDSPELFDETDLERTLFRLETEPIGIDFEPLPGLKVRFINAGHILGAACIYLKYGDRSLLYTGDYNTTSSRTTTGLRLADLPTADILITESTYGADVHPGRKTQETGLIEAIAEIVQAGGNVLIPAFALGRAQEILLAIRTYHLFHKLKIPIYVDGLVRAVTDVFRNNLDLLPAAVQNLVKQNGIEPFFDPVGTPPIISIGSPKERPLAMAHPSVIVASSGMLTGGASVYYATTLLERENAAIFISGYTDEESPGRLLQNLQTGDKIELDGKEVTVRAQIRRFNLSAHADKIGLTQVIGKVNPRHLILIHGGGNALHELARSGDLRSKYYIHIPSVGEAVEYGQAPEHLSKSQISRIALPQEFEVEIEAEVEGAWLRIPEEIVESDPRWSMFASSGILRAKWDGYHLKLSPVTQQNVATQKAIEDAIASGEDCCTVCQFFESAQCQCEDSPLFSLQVDPAGRCPEFKRL
ncbi:MAG: MBL fold metallo-hydrolase [Cyanobacteriota bacterium]|nr:MBL fold metallo-hydrolase [Cyanobacteriota bacterium]